LLTGFISLLLFGVVLLAAVAVAPAAARIASEPKSAVLPRIDSALKA
jgi:hypothetical protein